MKRLISIFGILLLASSTRCFSQADWPRDVRLSNGSTVTIYQPQPESLKGNRLVSRAVVSMKQSKNDDPVFGVVWAEAALLTDKDTRMATMDNIKVTQVRFPDLQDKAKTDELSGMLETEIPDWNLEMPIDQIVTTIEQDQGTSSDKISTDAPLIYYKNEPTTLITIDGKPVIKTDDNIKMDRVINTPFLIVKCPDDNRYYLYAGSYWYVSENIETGWNSVKNLPNPIRSLDTQVKEQQKQNQSGQSSQSKGVTNILVSTVPAEIIQTDGDPQWSSVPGTGLLYVSNSDDQIFKDISDQMVYILLSGRWYSAPGFRGPWAYIPSDKLPGDFAKIPEGSDKDAVLSSIAGTDAAREAVMDAQIPQTAKVDRTSTINVSYDGDPEFERIEGTELFLAVNSSITVMRSGNRYFAVDNGVWYSASRPEGPWSVSAERPSDVDQIPPSSPAYNTRYVYIYDVSPDYLYVGYTPGYLGCYIYGPTVVYGTGFYYRPWFRRYYYPRPYTWGFGMHYNPWSGWCFHYHYSYGWFGFSWGWSHSYWGGWWGPSIYRPAFYPHYHPGFGGFYGEHVTYNRYTVNNFSHNNIYVNRRDIVTRDVDRGRSGSYNRSDNHNPGTGNIPGQGTINRRNGGVNSGNAITRNQPNGNQDMNNRRSPTVNPNQGQNQHNNNQGYNRVTPKPNNRVPNNVFSDRQGNVYRKDPGSGWQQRQQNSWKPAQSEKRNIAPLERSSAGRQRAVTRSAPAIKNSSSKGSSKSGGKRR